MITVSSNLATNNLIALVGAENVMATLKSIGVRHMQVLRGWRTYWPTGKG